MKTALLLSIALSSAASGADPVALSGYLGTPSGTAAEFPNPPYTSIPTAAMPYGFGVNCPGNFASSPISFSDAGPFATGIGQHPFQSGTKQIDFNLAAIRVDTDYDLGVFVARVGIDFQTSIATTGGVFTVLVDDAVQSQQAINSRTGPSIPVAVSIVGASKLSLVTTTSGTFNSNHLCWGIATVSLIGGPCPADLNGDRLVDDADFSVFANGYNILDCAASSMPVGCPADLNLNGVVDDTDFTLFVPSYNTLICP